MNQKAKYYLEIGKAQDLKNKKERRIYRAFEILPGALVWLTLFGMVFVSWKAPLAAGFFIIGFCFYWLLRTLHFSLHLTSAYQKLKQNLKIDWQKKLEDLKNKDPKKDWQKIYHLIIFPMYKEDPEIVEASFEALIEARYPKDKMIVVLATEERAKEHSQKVAKIIREKYQDKFFKLLVTFHPTGLPGEIPGKGSNASFGIAKAKEFVDAQKIPYQQIIVSCFDVDTRVFPDYFSCLCYYYLSSSDPTHQSYQPIPLYLNNFWDAPFFSRVISSCNVFWQMIQQQRPEKITTYSSHSMPFLALVEMNFWQKNVVSEDAGIFWKALLFYDGNYKILPLHYPVSMDNCVAQTFPQTIKNLYLQQRRWAWGAEGIPYLLFGFLKNKKVPLPKKFHYGFLMIESFWAWGTNALLLLCLGWLPLVLGGEKFNATILSYNLPQVTRDLLTLALIGVITCIIINTLLLSSFLKRISPLRKTLMVAEWIFLPLGLILFGTIPAIEAQTRLMLGKYLGFRPTEKVRKPKAWFLIPKNLFKV